MSESIAESRCRSSDFNQLIADGGSNAIGGIQEYEVVSRVDGHRASSLDFDVCFSHQNERSSGYASGTIDFADDPNPGLGEILKKNHDIQVRMHRSAKRMNILLKHQAASDRSPCLKPDPANETRWQGKQCDCSCLYQSSQTSN